MKGTFGGLSGIFILSTLLGPSAPASAASNCRGNLAKLRKAQRRADRYRSRLRKLLLAPGAPSASRQAKIDSVQKQAGQVGVEIDRLSTLVKGCPKSRPKRRAKAKPKSKSKAKARAAAKAKAKAKVARAKAKAKAKAKAEAAAQARAKALAAAKAKAESEAKAKAQSEAKAKAESEAKAKAEAAAKAGSSVAKVQLAPDRIVGVPENVDKCLAMALRAESPKFRGEGVRRSPPAGFAAWHRRRQRDAQVWRIQRRTRELLRRCQRGQ